MSEQKEYISSFVLAVEVPCMPLMCLLLKSKVNNIYIYMQLMSYD